MSHFLGLVITTPNYSYSIDESLERYDANIELEEYAIGKVPNIDIAEFLLHYKREKKYAGLNEYAKTVAINKDRINTEMQFYEKIKDRKEIVNTLKHFRKKWGKEPDEYYISYKATNIYPDEYADFLVENKMITLDEIDYYYPIYGKLWNDNMWRKENGEWVVYSTCNPDAKYDYYGCGGKFLKTKSGECVDNCKLGDIDWSEYAPEEIENKDEDGRIILKKGVPYHLTKSITPYVLIVDGKWYEQGEMGWWGISYGDMPEEEWSKIIFDTIEKLPNDSNVVTMDFHI